MTILYNSIVKQVNHKIILFIIFIIAASLRLVGLNWDQGHHLHPDERFLNMTIHDIKLPVSFSEYLDPKISPLNPRNHNRNFFVYGNAPITFNKVITTTFGRKTLHEIALTGRVLSALADLLIILVIYKTVLLLERNINHPKLFIPSHTKLWACIVYALLVLPIQQSHFFTVDTFLNLFIFTSFYFSLNYFFNKKLIMLVFSAIFSGLAISSKISGLFILPLNTLFLFLAHWQNKHHDHQLKKQLINPFFVLLAFVLVTYFSLRLTSPYLFENSNILNPQVSTEFINNLRELKSWEGSDVWFPPAIQWINRGITFGFKNMILFGIGVFASIYTFVGIFYVIKDISQLLKNKKTLIKGIVLSSTLVWITFFLIYYALQFVQSIRYYLILYPFFAVFAGLGIVQLLKKVKLKLAGTILIILSLIIWPLMFISIYVQPHSRIKASEWIFQNIPPGSYLLTEHWDDALPLNLNGQQDQYYFHQLPVFFPDHEQKWQELEQNFSKADYYILSSNRAWGSIMRVPEKYPLMSQFYQDLLSGRTQFELVAEFNSYPSLEYLSIPITFDDSWAEEAFSVYDHPQVLVFRNSLK